MLGTQRGVRFRLCSPKTPVSERQPWKGIVNFNVKELLRTKQIFSVGLFVLDWGLNLRLLEPQFQSIFLWLFWRFGEVVSLTMPGLASNPDPSDLSLLSS
jgi:hypothetical protein